jgi:hypothetical protein
MAQKNSPMMAGGGGGRRAGQPAACWPCVAWRGESSPFWQAQYPPCLISQHGEPFLPLFDLELLGTRGSVSARSKNWIGGVTTEERGEGGCGLDWLLCLLC